MFCFMFSYGVLKIGVVAVGLFLLLGVCYSCVMLVVFDLLICLDCFGCCLNVW